MNFNVYFNQQRMTPKCNFYHKAADGLASVAFRVVFVSSSSSYTGSIFDSRSHLKGKKIKKLYCMAYFFFFFFFYQSTAVPHTNAGRGAEHVYTCAESSLSSPAPANPVSRAGVPCSREKAPSKQLEEKREAGSRDGRRRGEM